MNEQIKLDKTSKIILYGACTFGNVIFNQLKECGCNVIGFIDRRAEEIKTFHNLPVWTLEGVPTEYDKEEIIVFLTIKNVFEHEKVARNLIHNGFCNILYRTFAVLNGEGAAEEKYINEIYDDILEGKMKNEYFFKKASQFKPYEKDYAVVEEIGEKVTAYIPVDYIYTNHYEDARGAKWSDINLLAFFTHIQFFMYLSGDVRGKVENYINEFCVDSIKNIKDINVTESWKHSVVQGRLIVYEQMNLALDTDPMFFVRNAAEAEWNEKGFFNLLSGKHRTTFLVSKGKNYIPLRVSKADYEKFLKDIQITENKEYILENNLQEKLVFHPYFYKQSLSGYAKHYNILREIIRTSAETIYFQFGSINFENIVFADATSEDYVGRYFAKMGADIVRFNSDEFSNWLDDFYGINGEVIEMDECDKDVYLFSEFKNLSKCCMSFGVERLKRIYLLLEGQKLSEIKVVLENCGIHIRSVNQLMGYVDNEKLKSLVEIVL